MSINKAVSQEAVARNAKDLIDYVVEDLKKVGAEMMFRSNFPKSRVCVCEVRRADGTASLGTATCNFEDSFNVWVGYCIAMNRALGLTVKEELIKFSQHLTQAQLDMEAAKRTPVSPMASSAKVAAVPAHVLEKVFGKPVAPASNERQVPQDILDRVLGKSPAPQPVLKAPTTTTEILTADQVKIRALEAKVKELEEVIKSILGGK